MRRLFLPAAALTVISLFFLSLSLFHFDLITFRASTRITLNRASLRVWTGSAGDWGAFRFWNNIDIRGWSGNAAIWKPGFDRQASMFVQAVPTPAGGFPGAVPAKRITGTSITLPLYLPFLLFTAAAAITFFPWRSHRRGVAGRCRGCGYDLCGTPDRCPECGRESLVTRLLARFRRGFGLVPS